MDDWGFPPVTTSEPGVGKWLLILGSIALFGKWSTKLGNRSLVDFFFPKDIVLTEKLLTSNSERVTGMGILDLDLV